MTDPGAMLTEFHRAIDYPSRFGDGKQPKLVDRDFRASLILEESTETVQALLREDFAGAVDGCLDTIYVCIGSLDRWGVRAKWGETSAYPPVQLKEHEYYAGWLLNQASWTIQPILKGKLKESVDAATKFVTVCRQALQHWGVPFAPFFAEVHRSNMAKVGGPRRADGKIMKPAGWQPPRIAEMLEALREGQ